MMDEKEEFLERTLIKDLKKANLSNLTQDQKEEFKQEIDRKRGFSKTRFFASLSIFILIVLILLVFFTYLFQVEGIHRFKLVLEKPEVSPAINVEQVKYVLQEAGVYKLHSFIGKPAVIVVWITNTGQKFSANVNGELIVEEKNNPEYDVMLSLEDNIFKEIYANNETNKEIKRQINRKRLTIEKRSPSIDLALKGFPGMKTSLDPAEKKLWIFTSNQLRLIYMLVMIILLITTLIYLRKD